MNIPISSRRYSERRSISAGRGLRPAIIEKDYYVTEALRVIAAGAGDKMIFKGGTSLAKGWNLIQRFSEDNIPRGDSQIEVPFSSGQRTRLGWG